MASYKYSYQSIFRFDGPIERHFFKLRCIPCENACQQVISQTLSIHPAVCLTQGRDGLGNCIQYGHTLCTHDSFVFCSYGEVWLQDYRIPERAHPMYLEPSALTPLTADMRRFARFHAGQPGTHTPTETARLLCEAVYHYLSYRPGSTGNETTASTVFARREGVCQDYAHLLIALCRAEGVAARYVNGFIPGTGVTHAWVEIHDGEAWTGWDPTHNRSITCGYIKIAHGRDANDCPVNRGVFIGGKNKQCEIRVLVEPITPSITP